MKEYEIADDIEVEDANDKIHAKKEIEIDQSEFRKIENYKETYNNLPDVLSRLQFLIDAQVRIMALRFKENEEVLSKEERDFNDIFRSFQEKYIIGGTHDSIGTKNLIVDYLEKARKDSERAYETEYQKWQAFVDKKEPGDPDRDKKAKWFADQTGSRIDNSVICSFMQSFNSTFSNDYFKKRLKKTKGIILWTPFEKQENILKNAAPVEKADDKGIEEWIANVGKKNIRLYRAQELEVRIESVADKCDRKLKDSKIDRAFHENAYRSYRSIKTMEDKLKFIANYRSYLFAVKAGYGEKSFYGNTYSEMIADFKKKYITKGTVETNKAVLKAFGKLTAENKMVLARQTKAFRKKFKNDEKGVDKADYLAWNTLGGVRAEHTQHIMSELLEALSSQKNRSNKDEIWKKSGITRNTTVEEYAKIIGIKPKDFDDYMHKIVKAESKDEPIIDAYIKANNLENSISEKNKIEYFKENFVREYYKRELSKAEEKVISTKLSGDDRAIYDDVSKKLQGSLEPEGIDEWIENEGSKLAYNEQIRCAEHAKTEYSRTHSAKTVGYEQYIRLHTGYERVNEAAPDKLTTLSNALAANMMRKANVKFSISKIHEVADQIKKRPEFQALSADSDAVADALSSPNNLNEFELELFGKPFEVSTDNVVEYIKDIHRLYNEMMLSDGRSREYKAFSDAVKKISTFEQIYDYNSETDLKTMAKAVKEINMNIINTAKNYIKDKEKVRSSEDGKERFNNVIDVLAVVSQNTPGAQGVIGEMINSINTKRNAKAGSSKFIDLKEFGCARAQDAAYERATKNVKGSKHFC